MSIFPLRKSPQSFRQVAGSDGAGNSGSNKLFEARGRGCMIGIEINVSKDILASKIFAFRCLEKGIHFGYIGDKQRVIRVLPPIILGPDECDEVIRVVQETASEMHQNQIPAQTIEKVQKYAVGW